MRYTLLKPRRKTKPNNRVICYNISPNCHFVLPTTSRMKFTTVYEINVSFHSVDFKHCLHNFVVSLNFCHAWCRTKCNNRPVSDQPAGPKWTSVNFKKSKLSQLTCKWVEVSELSGWPGNCTGGNKSIVYGLWGGENPVKQICNFLRRHFCSYIKGDLVSGQTGNRVREWQLSP